MIGKDSHYETQCWRCHCSYMLPRALYVAAKASEKISFYCPYGHEAHFAAGETEEDKLRRERDLLKQRLAQRDDEITIQTKLIVNLKAQRAKVTQRISHGVCPCCNRQFQNMARHMATKHPEFEKFEKSMFKAAVA